MDGIIRRREMVEKADNGLIYSLYNHSVSRGDKIDTGITILKATETRTILLDLTTSENVTASSQVSSLAKYIYVPSNSDTRFLVFGKYAPTDGNCSYWWMATTNSQKTTVSGASPAIGRKRLIVTHEAGSNICMFYWRFGSGSVLSTTATKTFTASDQHLWLGYGGGTQLLGAGTINKCEVYNRIITAEERDAFFA